MILFTQILHNMLHYTYRDKSVMGIPKSADFCLSGSRSTRQTVRSDTGFSLTIPCLQSQTRLLLFTNIKEREVSHYAKLNVSNDSGRWTW